MRVALNARVLAKPEPAGVSRYTGQLLAALAARDDDIEYLIFGVESLPPDLRDRPHVENAGEAPPVPSGPRVQFWEQVTLPRLLRSTDADLLHCTAGSAPLIAPVPTLLTVHDVSPVTHPGWFSRSYATLYRLLTPLALWSVDHALTISEFSRTEITETYPWADGKVSVVHNGLDPIPEDDAERVDDLDEGQYLLFVGSLNPRKNVTRLLDAYERYRQVVDDPLPLVIAGSQRDVFAAVERPPIDDVHALGYVPDAKRNWLYHNATALVFPSLYEGFGLPIVEAMACGTPVLTSNRGAMAEVAADAALLVDPTDVDDMASGIERIAGDSALQKRLVEAGRRRAERFTWHATAEATVSVYRRIVRTAQNS